MDDVFVAAAGKIDDGDGFSGEVCLFCEYEPGQGVRAFQRGQDAFQPGEQAERIQHALIVDGDILGTAGVLEIRMFRPDAGIIQPGGDALGFVNLAVFILQDDTSGRRAGRRRCRR